MTLLAHGVLYVQTANRKKIQPQPQPSRACHTMHACNDCHVHVHAHSACMLRKPITRRPLEIRISCGSFRFLSLLPTSPRSRANQIFGDAAKSKKEIVAPVRVMHRAPDQKARPEASAPYLAMVGYISLSCGSLHSTGKLSYNSSYFASSQPCLQTRQPAHAIQLRCSYLAITITISINQPKLYCAVKPEGSLHHGDQDCCRLLVIAIRNTKPSIYDLAV